MENKFKEVPNRININEPRWDQSTYLGRAKHFFATTNPLNILCTSQELERARNIVTKYRKGEEFLDLSEDELWRAKQIYDSAFHPDTGEKMFIFGRMSAQVPCSTTIAVCMLTFYKSTKEVVFWQWFNQSFNAVVNYTNRSGDSTITPKQLGTCYALATGGAMLTAFGLNKLVKRSPPLLARFVPFGAVAAANCVNIPMMRGKEITDGLPVFDKDGNRIGESKIAAKRAISSVVFSRILMVSPGMLIPPIVMDRLENKGILKRYPMIGTPIQASICALTLIFMTPMCCALFPQKSSVSVLSLEPEIQERCQKHSNSPTVLYYNKGL